MPTAGILVIGNEILSGKVVDTNSPYLCRELRALGVDVERIITIPDSIDVIAEHVRMMHEAYDLVFTSGGIGPTHDDMTIDGIAAAFGRKLEHSESIAARLERAAGKDAEREPAEDGAGAGRRDADRRGRSLVPARRRRERLHLPGHPELLRKKFESARDRFRGVPFVLKRVYVTRMESEIAQHLHELLAEFPELHLGSYPKIQEESFRVMLTLESRDAGYVQRALDSLLGRLPDGAVRRVE
jgi:molybdenum cofactor synthesis domain-containing protein